MTFRPSDDVIDEINSNKQIQSSNYGYGNVWDSSNIWNWWNMFDKTDNFDWQITVPDEIANIINSSAEDVKAPDLSDLLNWNSNVNATNTIDERKNVVNNSVNNVWSNISTNENEDSGSGVKEDTYLGIDAEIPGSIPDEDRFKIVSWTDGAQHSNLDFFVDEQRKEVIEKYRKIYRIVARWWIFICILIAGILCWVMAQVKAEKTDNIDMIRDSNIIGKNRYSNPSESILKQVWDNLNVVVSYGSASNDGNNFQSRSNLLSYKWIMLPQLVSLNYQSGDLLSVDDFNNWEVSRSDLENAIKDLVTNNSIWKKTANFPSTMDSKLQGQVFGGWLIDWFNLSCLDAYKVSDFVCDKFLQNFYKYGKYYDLSRYSSEVLDLINILKTQGRDLKPMCDMIREYTLSSWITSSEDLYSAMSYCSAEEFEYYKKILDFINADNSLSQPELPSRIFNDSDINAYKLISARQTLYKILDGTSINENYINSYLVFVQNLINKDKYSGRYLAQVYKELLYVFNMDILYQKLLDKWALSNNIKTQIDKINNGDFYMDYIPLASQLKTENIVKTNETFSWFATKEKTLEDLSSQLFTTDYLTIRKITKISDTELNIQTEIFTDKILAITDWETLKAIINLYKLDDVLYVDNIRITDQADFSDILNAYAWNQLVTLPAMIAYMDEQIATRYQIQKEVEEQEPWLCDELESNESITLYNCDTSSILLYKWDIEYDFELLDWVLQSFKIDDADLNNEVNEKLDSVMMTKNNTPTIIKSIIEFGIDKETAPDNLDKKIRIMDQFRINLKLEPNDIIEIEWESDIFLVSFTLWDFDLQARYNVETHLMTRVSYVACDKVLEIRNLTINVSRENESQLTEILNNPRLFLTQANSAAYKKYQRLCYDPEGSEE